MDTFEPKSPEQIVPSETQAQIDALRHLIVTVLILVVVISGTLNIYFLRQYRDARRQLIQIRPQAAQVMATFQKSEAPMMQTLVNKFTEYGRAHPDYAPILSKYGITSASASAPPAAAPATKP